MLNPFRWLLCRFWIGHFVTKETCTEEPLEVCGKPSIVRRVKFQCHGCSKWIGYLDCSEKPIW